MNLNRINDLLNRIPGTLLLTGIFGIFLVWVAFYFNGTGDAGDSIVHYQFARYACQHPMNFFDSWAKPVFVLLAAPFSQAGFTGIKLFNVLIALLTAVLLQRSALKLGIAEAWLSVILLFATPLYFILIFSGLTEHLFALFMIAGIYLLLHNRIWAAVILFSFLPFVRAEGILILPVIAVYLMVKKKWIMIPLLATGHLAYGIGGLFAHGDFLWMFHLNAYVGFGNEYGNGNWMHFVSQLNYVIGVPLYILFGAGMIAAILGLFIKKFKGRQMMAERIILIWGSFLVIFIAHTVFWKYGLYHSMGLKRVLNAVVPLAVLISLDGFSFITGAAAGKRKWLSVSLKILLSLVVVIFPFTRNPAAVNVSKDLCRSASQSQMHGLAEKIIKDNTDIGNIKIYCIHPYLQFAFDMDPFDTSRTESLIALAKSKDVPDGSVAIWDCEISEKEGGVSLQSMMNDKRFELLYTWPEDQGGDACFAVFRKAGG